MNLAGEMGPHLNWLFRCEFLYMQRGRFWSGGVT